MPRGKAKPVNPALLNAISAENLALKAHRASWELDQERRYEQSVKEKRDRLYALVRRAADEGETKTAIAAALGGSNRVLVYDILKATEQLDRHEFVKAPGFEFDGDDHMTVLLNDVDLTPLGYDGKHTGAIPFVLDPESGTWDYDTEEDGYDVRAAGLIADALALRNNDEWNAWFDNAKEN